MAGHRIGYTLWPADFELTEPGAFLDEAEALGVDTVEIPFFATRLIANGRIVEPMLGRFEAQMRDRSVGYTAHAALSINLMDTPERLPLHEKVTRSSIELSARLGARNMVIHCGISRQSPGNGLDTAYGRQRDSLAALGDFAAEHGVLLCVETVWSDGGGETALPAKLAAELRAVGHPAVCATLDYAHSALQCALKGADLIREVSELAPLAQHIHLNDCFGIDHGMGGALPSEALAYGSGDLHLPVGWGELPWDELVSAPDYPEDVVLNLELHPTFWPELANGLAEISRLSGLMLRRGAQQ